MMQRVSRVTNAGVAAELLVVLMTIGCPSSSPPGISSKDIVWDQEGAGVDSAGDLAPTEEVGPRPCLGPEDCDRGWVCDPTTHVCVECVLDSDCPSGFRCSDHACIPVCTPNCRGADGSPLECGPDGCGGVCGECPTDQVCEDGHCSIVCLPQCEGRECGDNRCGGVCGVCEPGFTCLEGQCVGGGSCAQGLDCAWTCTDEATADSCIAACADGLAAGEREAFEALMSCLNDHCNSGPPAEACWKQVLEGPCNDLRDACVACAPSCAGHECGPDGCGGFCGTCPAGTACEEYRCVPVCVPQCSGKQCGTDGCGGACGTCAQGETCENGQCACVPQCAGKQCGPDGCGGSCGTCPGGTTCQNGACACVPQCAGKQCGPDGCGGSCGSCPPGQACENGQCACVPQCTGKQCGSDGCGGSCGTCKPPESCNVQSGQCEVCTPSCAGKQCGPDGCGGSCGTCAQGETCENGKCVCVPQCSGKDCGPDGCGGSCGSCKVGYYCVLGHCQQECLPNCIGKPCGPDGCGGSCGTCPAGSYCSSSQQCVPSCIPACAGKACGPDGCGGQCGGCGADEYCSKEGQCLDFWSCYDILVCSWGCAPQDEACTQQCFQQGSPAAQKQWMDLWKCLFDQCGNKPPQSPCWSQAIAGACKPLYYACLDCTPNCLGKQCGPDGCGGSCGTCPDGAACNEYGQCPCVPKCTGKECGPDGCGGLCGTCAEPLVCNASGRCVCVPQCSGKECGPDGCGGSCGKCPDNWTCVLGKCESPCQPQCAGKQCGPDGCGGTCGTCPEGQKCIEDLGVCAGTSSGCEPSQTPGCGGCPCEKCVCGLDPYCCQIAWDDLCVQECWQCGGCGCLPNCTNPDGSVKQCGPDGCGGSCGSCPPGFNCTPAGQCIPGGVLLSCQQGIDCVFSCRATFDFCVQSCGEQVAPDQRDAFYSLMKCAAGPCLTPWGTVDPACFYQVAKTQCEPYYLKCIGGCVPNCLGKQCGPDGCGGSCGTCPPGTQCTSSGQCQPASQKGCADAVQCVLSCGGLDWSCIQGCMSGLSPQSQQLLTELVTCVVQACGFNLDQVCIMQALQGPCQKQFLACMSDGGGVIILDQ